MKFAVRYYTRSGNTKKLAEAIAEAVSADARDVSVALEEKVDILFLGCSYYAFDVNQAIKDFHCKGQFGNIHKGRPNETDLTKATEFAKRCL